MLLLPILNYHHVGLRTEPFGHRHLWVSTERLTQHLGYLAQEGYRCLALRDCVPYLAGTAPAPPRLVALTFDDGYANFLSHAYPILKEHGFSASVSVVTGEVGGRSHWDRGWESPLMGWDDIVALNRKGIEIASHTVSHPALTHLSPDLAREELKRSRRVLEEKLGIPVTTLVYPYGDVNSSIEEAAKQAGYHLACSSDRGNRHDPCHLFRLKRVPMDEFVTIARLRRRLSSLYHYTCYFQQVSRGKYRRMSRD